MRKNLVKSLAIAASLAINYGVAFSQTPIEEAKKYISVFFKEQYDQSAPQKAIQEKGEKIGIFMPYLALKFSTGISGYPYKLAGLTTESAFVMLDIDTTVFQEITDEFYLLFSEKLKATGIRIVTFEEVQKSALYQDLIADPITSRSLSDVWVGKSRIYTQNNAPLLSLPGISPKRSKWINALKATPSILRLNIDFFEFGEVLDTVKTYKVEGSSIVPTIKIAGSSDLNNTWINFFEGTKTILDSDKAALQDVATGFQMAGYMKSDLYFTNKSIYESIPSLEVANLKDANLPDWAISLRNKYNAEMNNQSFQVIGVKIDREIYKKAVLAALNKYSDYLVTVIKSYQQ